MFLSVFGFVNGSRASYVPGSMVRATWGRTEGEDVDDGDLRKRTRRSRILLFSVWV